MVRPLCLTAICAEPSTCPAGWNILQFRPFDEVRNDQEVAGELHALDDADLELQPFAILLLGKTSVQAALGETPSEAIAGLQGQFLGLGHFSGFCIGHIGAGETWQDGLAVLRVIGAALRDLNRVVDRFRQVGEQPRHVGLALQIIVWRQPPALVRRDHRTLGDGDQRVMRFEILA